MRLVFAGTPPFAAAALAALLEAGHQVVAVLTQPDRPAGRGMRLSASAVKQCAVERGLTIAQPLTLRDEDAQRMLTQLAPEVMVVAAYGLLLPPAVLAIPQRGCLNIHASLLPRWRGAAPVQRALLAGDPETGISIMQMEAGLDTGPVWLKRGFAIAGHDTAGSLLDRLSVLGGQMIVEVLGSLDRLPPPRAQPADGVTYAHKVEKREAAIDFGRSVDEIDRQVRAFDPVPGAFCRCEGQLLKVWRALPGEGISAARPHSPFVADKAGPALPGTVLAIDPERGIEVACGNGSLWLHEVQRAGGRRQHAWMFAQAHSLVRGLRLSAGEMPEAIATRPEPSGPAVPGADTPDDSSPGTRIPN